LHGFAKILRYALKCIQFLLGAAIGDVLMHKIYNISVFLVIALPLNLFAEQKFYGIYSNMMASDGEPLGKFKGKIENENLIGEFIETKQRVFLKKGQSFWQKQ